MFSQGWRTTTDTFFTALRIGFRGKDKKKSAFFQENYLLRLKPEIVLHE
jgi:hypothetical protein